MAKYKDCQSLILTLFAGSSTAQWHCLFFYEPDDNTFGEATIGENRGGLPVSLYNAPRHATLNNILYSIEHGFRDWCSCETQLIKVVLRRGCGCAQMPVCWTFQRPLTRLAVRSLYSSKSGTYQ